jgi:hypothetical protein
VKNAVAPEYIGELLREQLACRVEFGFQQEHGGEADGGFAGCVGSAKGGGSGWVECGEYQDEVDIRSWAQAAFGGAAVEDH